MWILSPSLSEQNTGREWVDGNPVFERSYQIPTLPNAVQNTHPHGIDVGMFIDVFGIADNGTTFVPLPWVHVTPASLTSLWADSNNIVIMNESNRTAFNRVFVTLRYTKAS